ncbi:ABC transporter substrate-binding protein [Serinicoccus chungangensis]|uniref:ABC transporter substrate-binding protein n=1 Tax=Serinicoccus chungangensis TaxID=767452 RepID=UPI001EE883C9|nr:ABC transporter substrate-binding protein [Serinicoccus chungangensis]
MAASLGLAGVTLAACGGSGGSGGGEDVDEALASVDVSCEPYEQYGDLEGTTVGIYTSIVSPEDQAFIESFTPFEECTGVTVEYEGSRQFETQLPVRLEAGNAPDMAWVPQPGLVERIVNDFPDAVVPVGEQAEANVDEYYNESWKGYGTVDGTYYGAPLGANVKSFVWYAPAAFEENGYEIPETWDDMYALSEQIAADHPDAKPWCAGIESGNATGWPATDWLEDVMLRAAGPEVYDQWVAHEIPFDDPTVVDALNQVGTILKNPDMVNGGLGGVESIAVTPFGEAGLPILDRSCFLHRQASFYQANWPEGTNVAEDGDVFAFYLPGNDPEAQPVLVGGEFTMMFADRPEVKALQAYLASPEWSNAKAKVSPPGWVSANSGLDPANLKSPIDQLAYELLTDEATTIRFDGSDLMPAAIGTGSFWTGMTNWITGEDTESVLTMIENSWD